MRRRGPMMRKIKKLSTRSVKFRQGNIATDCNADELRVINTENVS